MHRFSHASKVIVLLMFTLLAGRPSYAQGLAEPTQPKYATKKVCDLFGDPSPNFPKFFRTVGTGGWGGGTYCSLAIEGNWEVDHDQTIDIAVIYKNDARVAMMQSYIDKMHEAQPQFFKKMKMNVCAQAEVLVGDAPINDDRSGGEAYARCGKYDFLMHYKGRKALAILEKVIAEVVKHPLE